MTDFKVGDFVTYCHSHGASGEGVIWQVTKIRHTGLKHRSVLSIKPVWTATGPSYRKPTRALGENVERLGVVGLGLLRMQIDELCRTALANDAGVEPEKKECNTHDQDGKVNHDQKSQKGK